MNGYAHPEVLVETDWVRANRSNSRRSVPGVGPAAHFVACRLSDTPPAMSSVCEEAVAGPPARVRPRSARRESDSAERRFLTGLGVVWLGGAGLLSYAACSILRFEAAHARAGRCLPAELLVLVAAFVLFVMGLCSFRQAGQISPVSDTSQRQER